MPDQPDRRCPPPLEAVEEDADHSSKVGGQRRAALSGAGEDAELTAILKVTTPGYVPDGVTRRAVISQTLFTATVSRRRLAALDDDPRIVSVEVSPRPDQPGEEDAGP